MKTWKWYVGYVGGFECAFFGRQAGDHMEIEKLSMCVLGPDGRPGFRKAIAPSLGLCENSGRILTSGVMLFAATQKAIDALESMWARDPSSVVQTATMSDLNRLKK